MPTFEPPSKDVVITFSISGIWNWFKKRKEKQDIDNIHKYEEEIKCHNPDEVKYE
jgi:hypothetical protein